MPPPCVGAGPPAYEGTAGGGGGQEAAPAGARAPPRTGSAEVGGAAGGCGAGGRRGTPEGPGGCPRAPGSPGAWGCGAVRPRAPEWGARSGRPGTVSPYRRRPWTRPVRRPWARVVRRPPPGKPGAPDPAQSQPRPPSGQEWWPAREVRAERTARPVPRCPRCPRSRCSQLFTPRFHSASSRHSARNPLCTCLRSAFPTARRATVSRTCASAHQSLHQTKRTSRVTCAHPPPWR